MRDGAIVFSVLHAIGTLAEWKKWTASKAPSPRTGGSRRRQRRVRGLNCQRALELTRLCTKTLVGGVSDPDDGSPITALSRVVRNRRRRRLPQFLCKAGLILDVYTLFGCPIPGRTEGRLAWAPGSGTTRLAAGGGYSLGAGGR
jgi:hypothetical protein